MDAQHESCAMSVPASRTGNFCLASNTENQSEKRKVDKNNHRSQPQLLPQDTNPEKKKRPKHCRSGTNLPSVVGRQEPRGAAFRRSSSQQQCPIHLADSQLRLPSSSLLIGVLCPIVRSKWENKSNFGDALMYGGASGCNGKEAAMLKIALLLPVITIYEN